MDSDVGFMGMLLYASNVSFNRAKNIVLIGCIFSFMTQVLLIFFYCLLLLNGSNLYLCTIKWVPECRNVINQCIK